MADAIILTIPEDISSRARQIAETTAQPVEQVLLEHLKSLTSPLPTLPPEEQAELDAHAHLSDDALWTIAREQMPDEIQARAHALMSQNSHSALTDEERAELELLTARSDRLMLRKAEAATILRQRGHSFSQQDFMPLHE
ncbi:MAG: hypothetical protein K8L99_33870 [Anaerolineae bacterium]|nr:hypothetical protein [Anaerolineae bacterium]